MIEHLFGIVIRNSDIKALDALKKIRKVDPAPILHIKMLEGSLQLIISLLKRKLYQF